MSCVTGFTHMASFVWCFLKVMNESVFFYFTKALSLRNSRTESLKYESQLTLPSCLRFKIILPLPVRRGGISHIRFRWSTSIVTQWDQEQVASSSACEPSCSALSPELASSLTSMATAMPASPLYHCSLQLLSMRINLSDKWNYFAYYMYMHACVCIA